MQGITLAVSSASCAPLPQAEELVRGVPLGPGVEEYRENGLIGRAPFSDEKTLNGVTAGPGGRDQDLAIQPAGEGITAADIVY